jgi:ABC-type glycerol-3-phosphate transport system permease component
MGAGGGGRGGDLSNMPAYQQPVPEDVGKMTARGKNRSHILVYVVLICGSVGVLVPLLWMVSPAFKSMTEITGTTGINIIPKHITYEAFVNIWKDYPMLTWLRNSIVIVVFETLIAIAVSALAGYGTSRFRFRGRGTMMTFLLVTQMFPAIMMIIPYYKVLQTLHLINTLTSLVVVYISSTIPMLTWMMMGYFEGIPRELDEAALIDGCSRFRTFRQIILPLTLPGLISAAIYAFIHGWNEYMYALILINNDNLKTLPVGIGQMNGFYRIMWNDLMAASIVSSLPLLILFLFLQKYFVSSLTAGAVKQ